MKKRILKGLGIALAAVLTIGIAGCSGEEEKHEHTFATKWTSNETTHWHAATCEHTDQKSGQGAHLEDSGEITIASTCMIKGKKNIKCSVCNEVFRTADVDALGWCESAVDAQTFSAATKKSTYIYFGVFPKTVLPAGSMVIVNEEETTTMGPNTYYKGSDGEWYAKVIENCYDSREYKYTDNTIVKGKDAESIRYFKVEPIKWKVLTTDYNNTGKALLLAEDIVTANVPYYVSGGLGEFGSKRIIDEDIVYGNNYKYSTIRAYLNGKYESGDSQTTIYKNAGFLQMAFTVSAQALIAETTVVNDGASTSDATGTCKKADGTAIESGSIEGGDAVYYPDYTCANTTDKIFLLSEQEVTTTSYGFEAYDSSGRGNARIRETTDYAKANCAFQDESTGFGGWWFLRSPDNILGVLIVDSDGSAKDNDYLDDLSAGIVPALTISLPNN